MIFLSPGVKSEEIDYSTYVGQVSSCIVGIIGGASKGEIGVYHLITSPTQLVETYGEPLLDDYGLLAAIEYLKKGNILYYCRAAESTAKQAVLVLHGGLLTFRAKDKGLSGDNLAVEITNSNGSAAKLNVYEKGIHREQFDFSFDPQSPDFIENINSNYLLAEFDEDMSSTPEVDEESFSADFIRSAEKVFELTLKQDIRDLDVIEFATMYPSVPSALKCEGDSFGIIPVGEPIGDLTSEGEYTQILLSDDAKVAVPEALVYDLKLTYVTSEMIKTETDYEDVFSEKFVEILPWADGNRGPLVGNPWLVVDFKTASPMTELRFMAYKKGEPEKPLLVEFQTSSGPSNRTAFRNAGPNFMSFECLRSRASVDTLNINPDDFMAGIYVLRVEVLNGKQVVQLLEDEFEIKAEELDGSIKTGDALVSVPTINVPSLPSTKEGLRVLHFSLTLTNSVGATLPITIKVDPSDREVIPWAQDVTKDFIIPTIQNTELSSLSGGNNGCPLKPATVIAAAQNFRAVDIVDINLIAAPGQSHVSVVTELIDIAESRSDCMAIIDPPQGLSPEDVVKWHNGLLVGDGYPTKVLDSSYGALYYPWVQINDIYSGQTLWAPPSGVALGAFANNDVKGNCWTAAAGLNRGMLTSVVGLERNLTDGERDVLYGLGNVVNPIVNYKQQGITIWGQRTLQRKSSATDRINVRRLVNMVRKAIAASTAYLVFEQNDPFTWRQWKGMVDPYLDTIKASRGLYDYRTIMDETTVTPTMQDQGMMPGKVFLKPTRTSEFIPISFIITSSGASFDDM